MWPHHLHPICGRCPCPEYSPVEAGGSVAAAEEGLGSLLNDLTGAQCHIVSSVCGAGAEESEPCLTAHKHSLSLPHIHTHSRQPSPPSRGGEGRRQRRSRLICLPVRVKMAAPIPTKPGTVGGGSKPAAPELDFRSGARVEELNKLIQEFSKHDQREYDDQRALEIHTAKDFIFSMLGNLHLVCQPGPMLQQHIHHCPRGHHPCRHICIPGLHRGVATGWQVAGTQVYAALDI